MDREGAGTSAAKGVGDRHSPGSQRDSSSPLAAFSGEKPAAPAWFVSALSDVPERRMLETPRGAIEMLLWGEVGKPGLLFVHGSTAHADWWSFIAPFFAADYRVAAMSLAGMGASQWREHYAPDDFVLDASDVASAADLSANGHQPVYIGHSFGGRQVLYAAAHAPGHLRAAIVIDTLTGEPTRKVAESRSELAKRIAGNPEVERTIRIYPNLPEAIARFRLMPPQRVENLFILDHIARTSISPVAVPGGAEPGWTWKFDQRNMQRPDKPGRPMERPKSPPPEVPLAHIIGEMSAIHNRDEAGHVVPIAPHEIQIEIPQAAHHIMLDQPLALISVLRSILTVWRA